MKVAIRVLLMLVLPAATIFLALPPIQHWWEGYHSPTWVYAQVTSGEIISVVNATGTVKPVLSIRVGSVVSGPVKKLYVDYNSRIEKDGILAEIDPQIFEAIKSRDEAALAIANSEIARNKAQLQQAINDQQRAKALREKNPGNVSDSDMDKYQFARESLEAERMVAEAQVKQAEANLRTATTNLGYTKIRSPVDGVVLDRNIDEGQTLMVQFQVPDLFVVAPDLDRHIHVYASVDEADVGLIRDAQRNNQPAFFTVDAYPDELFEGKIFQIRMNPTSKENVVTYDVIVASSNQNLKLLPGMTAQISFQIERKENVIKVPNAALRFYPNIEFVRDEDRKLLEADESGVTQNSGDETVDQRSAVHRMLDRRASVHRHVWHWDGKKLCAREITTGLSDHTYTEVVAGDLKAGEQVVTLMTIP